MSVLFYRRPNYVDRPAGPLNQEDCQKYVERTKNNKNNIPSELSFDNVIENKAMPPCSLRDFMDYLVYVAHDAENLQFYLWLRDYTSRYNALKKEEKALSPEWTSSELAPELNHNRMTKRASAANLGVQIDFEKAKSADIPRDSLTPVSSKKSPFADPDGASTIAPSEVSTDYETFVNGSMRSHKTVTEIAEEATTQVGLKWQAFSVQPFRPEINKIIAHYLAPGAPRELNLSHRDRTAVLHALQHTTHPSAFTIVSTMVEATLRGQLHPNFIRWSICNGNKPKVFFVRTMGVSHTIGGIIVALILTLSGASRWYRILSAIVTFIGISTLVAAYKGLCVILHASGKVRNLRPWEEFEGSIYSDKTGGSMYPGDEESTLAGSDLSTKDGKSLKRPRSLDTFGSANTFSDESWVEKYQKKPLLHKVFEQNTWVQDDAIRLIQDKIVQQSQVWGVILTFVITATFVALPKGNLY